MFAILAILWCWALLRTERERVILKKAFILTAVIVFLYGVSMEFVQKFFIPNRSFDVGDILADGAGCALGLVFSLRKYIKK
jgi:VanZ family protein